ncbi:MAG: flagellar hook-associated protein FlgK, partial [Deltaproteobacteria bacterium]|nr:flagellar hook-associated protein FlgK [Deltaproteobacteria bacterium]
MSGISHILDMAARALLGQQVGLEVTSHNVTNVNTPGYSRQKVCFETAAPLPSPWGPLGDGVRVQGIERAFDPFITAKLNETASELAEYQAHQAYLDQVASLFNETQEAALNDRLSKFWAAWQDLANNPTGSGERQALLQSALSLCEILNFQADGLVRERTALVQRLGPLLEDVNAHAARIAELNRAIQETEANGQTANDLRDLRQQELARLSQLIGIRYYTDTDGMVNVYVGQGTSLVQGVQSWTLDFTLTAADTLSIRWNGPNGLQEDITAHLSGGQVAALLQVRDSLLAAYQAALDQLAQDLITAVNAQHTQGVGLELFSSLTGTYAVTDPDLPLDSAGLPFGDDLTASSFVIHVERDGTPLAAGTIAVDPGMTLNELINAINTDPELAGLVTASLEGNRLKLTANSGTDTFGFSQDTAGLLASLGLNTFFDGDKAYTLAVNPWVLANPDLIAA